MIMNMIDGDGVSKKEIKIYHLIFVVNMMRRVVVRCGGCFICKIKLNCRLVIGGKSGKVTFLWTRCN